MTPDPIPDDKIDVSVVDDETIRVMVRTGSDDRAERRGIHLSPTEAAAVSNDLRDAAHSAHVEGEVEDDDEVIDAIEDEFGEDVTRLSDEEAIDELGGGAATSPSEHDDLFDGGGDA